MPRTVLLHHPDLGRDVTCTPAQARVLAQSGWQRVGGSPPPAPTPEPPPELPDDTDTTDDAITDEE